MRDLNRKVENVAYGLQEFQYNLESWWRYNVHSEYMNLQSDAGCFAYFKAGEEYDGNYTNGIDLLGEWEGEWSEKCALPYLENGNIDWTGMNEFYGISTLQKTPQLKIENLSAVDINKWVKASSLNLNAIEKVSSA